MQNEEKTIQEQIDDLDYTLHRLKEKQTGLGIEMRRIEIEMNKLEYRKQSLQTYINNENK